MVARYTPIALSIANRARRSLVMDADALRNIAVDGLIEAIATHDPSRSKLLTWARNVITWRVRENICGKRGSRRFKWEACHEPLEGLDKENLHVFDDEPEGDALVERLLGSIPPRDAAIVRAWAIDGETMESIGKRHGMRKSNVSRICRVWLAALAADRSALAATEDWRRPIPA